MKALHLASFNGNIGDIANHTGFYRCFREFVDPGLQVEQIEIRDFYRSWGLRKFDDSFLETVNKHDLFVIGGGGFFRPNWDYSVTGTTLDFSQEFLDAIQTPVLFNSVGFDVDQGVTESTINKFGNFLHSITQSPKYLTSVRNDGSKKMLRTYYEKDLCDRVLSAPDFGYLVDPPRYRHAEIAEGKTNIAIVLGGDMAQIRFPDRPGYLTREEFTQIFSGLCADLLDDRPNLHAVFVPCIPLDIGFIRDVMEHMPDKLLRQRISCAPCLNGTQTDGLYNIDLFRHCGLVLGMRHHANICAIAMNAPNVAIVNYGPHEEDYHEIGIPHRCIKVNRPGFEAELKSVIESALDSPDSFIQENKKVLANMQTLCGTYFSAVSRWLSSFRRE